MIKTPIFCRKTPPLRPAGIFGCAPGLLLGLVLCLFAGCNFQKESPREIRLDSEPAGASLILNGKELGRLPYTLKEPALGKYLLHLEKEGCEPLDRILEITSESPPEIIIKLEKMLGLVLFESTPTGAELSVNGAYKGKTPLLCADLLVGKHKLTFALAGYDPRET